MNYPYPYVDKRRTSELHVMLHKVDQALAVYRNEGLRLPTDLVKHRDEVVAELAFRDDKPKMIRRLARRYRDGEEMEALGQTGRLRYDGRMDRLRAVSDALASGITENELFDEVAQIDVEEDDVQ